MKKLLLNTPILLLFVFFSINGFAQADTTKQSSDHPLLDKYYPRPKEDTVAKNPVLKSKGVLQKNVIATPKNTPQPQPIEEKRLSFPTPVQRPVIAAAPAPAQKDSVVIVETETPVTAPMSTGVIVSDSKLATPVFADSAKIAKSVIVTATTTPPPAKKTTSKIDPGYQRNRLGSSSPLYNTYEKNAKGAGSVTTMPKR